MCAPCVASAAELPSLEIYGHLAGFQMAALSPSGDHIAVLGTVEGRRRVVVLDANRKLVFAVPIDADAKVRSLDWVGDQSVLVVISTTLGNGVGFTTSMTETGSVIVVPLDGSKPWRVFADDEQIAPGVWGTYGVVQKNGRWLGYFGGLTLERTGMGFAWHVPFSGANPDLFEVDLQTGKHHKVAGKTAGDHDRRRWLLDDKGEIGAVLDVIGSTGQWSVTGGHGQKLASGINLEGNIGLVGFTPDGSGVIYALRDAAAATDSWYSVPLAGGAAQPYLDGISVNRWFRDDGHRLLGYIEDNATNDAHFFDVRHDKIYKASQRAFPGERVVLTDMNTAFDRLLLVTEGPGDPETWWLISIATGKALTVGYSYPLDAEQVGPMKMVPYSAADGLKMEGVLTLPPGRPAKALPAVILPHGGPASYDTVRFNWLAQAFASRGYAVFQPNFRGSTGYGTAFELAGKGEWGRKMQTDISDGLAELVRQSIVDPGRVCILGASYGGYAALAGVTLQHGLYRCAVAIAGISDLARMVNDDITASGEDPMLIHNLKREIGSGHDLKTVSPVRFADKVTVPVLLIHGKDDTVVNFNQSTMMADALRRAGKPVDFVTLKAEDHWLSKGETRLQMLQASVDFVTRNNPPDAPPAAGPAKAQ